MQQSINMLDFRKSPGSILNEVFYGKKRIILERDKKKLAALIPIDFYEKLFESEDIELYSDERIKEFMKEDKLSEKLKRKVKKLLNIK
jgi:hypothetical protein